MKEKSNNKTLIVVIILIILFITIIYLFSLYNSNSNVKEDEFDVNMLVYLKSLLKELLFKE